MIQIGVSVRTLTPGVTGDLVGGAGPGRALPRFDRGASRFAFAKTHRKAGCAQYPFKILGSTVGALHFKLVLVLELEKFEDVIAFQTPKLIYRHGHSPFIGTKSIANLGDSRNSFMS